MSRGRGMLSFVTGKILFLEDEEIVKCIFAIRKEP